MYLLLQVADLDFECFFLLLELFLNFENLDVDHLVLLDLGDELFLGQLQVLVDLLKFLFDLHHLLGAIAGEEASAEVAGARLLVLRILLPLVLELLQSLDSLGQSLIVEAQLIHLLLLLLQLIFDVSQFLSLLLDGGRLFLQVVSQGLVLLFQFFIIRLQIFHVSLF